MAFESKRTPGKKFGNVYQQKRYDAAGEQAEPKEEKVKVTGETSTDKNEGAPKGGNAVDKAVDETENPEGQEEGEGEMHPVVQAHGPAHSIHIKHDHEAGRHHVHSTHKDGHENMSEHETSQEAHQEGGKLANVDMKKTDEAGEQQGAASQGDNDSTDGFQMPDLM